MSERQRTRLLQIILRVWAAASIGIFGMIFIAYALQLNAFRPGGSMHWTVWDDMPGHVALMLSAIYLTWAVYLLLASRRPVDYRSFLDFTMWVNLVHALVMVPGALEHGYHSKFLTDIPWILVLSAAIFLLRPRTTTPRPTTATAEASR
ncbi:DUF6632 domain-containing protein [Mycobacterium antarcticum]|uniref:DUF6632 domain-containing protein n=1 Tax=Mycolicibacterium sp. TUM20984 TaxID=3023368 RepID=UPI00239358BA|nr:DUF6632 domain-containing protein [Mycolicibacterium sp. TUM20984]GLP82291.1 hypothetical protein TUM20984_37110 [Mycolicibacterium sp. TUM20984]